MRHRTRTQATHLLTATRQTDSTQEDEYGSPLPGDDGAVIEDEPVDYRQNGTTYTRTESGQRVERNPEVRGRGILAFELQEGDSVELDPLDDAGSTLKNFEVAGIDPQHGRRKHPEATIVELEAV